MHIHTSFLQDVRSQSLPQLRQTALELTDLCQFCTAKAGVKTEVRNQGVDYVERG